MTEKELRKLSRVELLKLLVEVTEENEMLRAQLQGQQELSRRAQIQDSQEVRDSVEDVFRTVESTATGFLSKAQGIADQIIEDARVRADRMIHDAEARVAQAADPVEVPEAREEPVIAPYEAFTAAAPQMQQVIGEIALEQSPQQSAEDAFATDALFAGTNATEVTQRRLTEVRVTEPAPVAAEPAPVVQQAEIAPAFPQVTAPVEAPADAQPAPVEAPAPAPGEAPAPVIAPVEAPLPAPAPAVYPEQLIPQEEDFRIEGLEENATAQNSVSAGMPVQQQERPLTAIDMLKRLQGGS
ncbi:MAG: hypothetical protein IK016_10135 [Lachnospiraceae bacterium]|nr:hypothetical protein [Lachnospiraceae bacterium]